MTQAAGEKSYSKKTKNSQHCYLCYTCSYGGYLVASNRLVDYHII